MSALAGLYHYGVDLTSVLGKPEALLTAAIQSGLILAFTLFIKGGMTSAPHNINANGNKIYDFFVGRELAPSVGPANIKAMLVRFEFITIVSFILYVFNRLEACYVFNRK